MFEVAGTLAGRRRTVRWDDGQLAGDELAVDEVRLLVTTGRLLPLTATGPSVTPALQPAAVAFRTIVEVFDAGTVTASGDTPVTAVPALPDEAIG